MNFIINFITYFIKVEVFLKVCLSEGNAKKFKNILISGYENLDYFTYLVVCRFWVCFVLLYVCRYFKNKVCIS